MTLEERKEKAVAEYNDVLNWSVQENNRVIERLRREGRLLYLDGHKDEFHYIKETRRRCLEEIFDKYDLPREETP